MKTKFILLAMFIAVSAVSVAQDKKDGKLTKEQRVEMRVAKVQADLMLDDATAVKFAPLYKAYMQELAACHPQLERGKNLTDEQIEKNLQARLNSELKVAEVKKAYLGKFAEILNAKQLQKLYNKDNAYKKGGDRKFMNKDRMGKNKDGKCKDGKKDCKKDCKKDDCKKKDNCKKDCKKDCKK
jgi:hypothetical protein